MKELEWMILLLCSLLATQLTSANYTWSIFFYSYSAPCENFTSCDGSCLLSNVSLMIRNNTSTTEDNGNSSFEITTSSPELNTASTPEIIALTPEIIASTPEITASIPEIIALTPASTPTSTPASTPTSTPASTPEIIASTPETTASTLEITPSSTSDDTCRCTNFFSIGNDDCLKIMNPLMVDDSFFEGRELVITLTTKKDSTATFVIALGDNFGKNFSQRHRYNSTTSENISLFLSFKVEEEDSTEGVSTEGVSTEGVSSLRTIILISAIILVIIIIITIIIIIIIICCLCRHCLKKKRSQSLKVQGSKELNNKMRDLERALQQGKPKVVKEKNEYSSVELSFVTKNTERESKEVTPAWEHASKMEKTEQPVVKLQSQEVKKDDGERFDTKETRKVHVIVEKFELSEKNTGKIDKLTPSSSSISEKPNGKMHQQLELSPKHISGIHTSVERLEPTHGIEKDKSDNEAKKPDMEGSKTIPLSHDTRLPNAKATQVGMVESVTKIESKKQLMKETSKIEAMKKHFSADFTPKKPDMEGSKATPLSHDTCLPDAKTTRVGMVESATKIESKKQLMKETNKIQAMKKHFSADFTAKKPVGITQSAEDTVKKPLLVSDDLKNPSRLKNLQTSLANRMKKTSLHHEEPTYAQPTPLSPTPYDSVMCNTDDIELQANIVYGVSIGPKDDSTVIANNSNMRGDSELEIIYPGSTGSISEKPNRKMHQQLELSPKHISGIHTSVERLEPTHRIEKDKPDSEDKEPNMEGSKTTPLSHNTCLPDAKTTQVGMVESVTKIESKKRPMKETNKIEAKKKHFSADFTAKKPVGITQSAGDTVKKPLLVSDDLKNPSHLNNLQTSLANRIKKTSLHHEEPTYAQLTPLSPDSYDSLMSNTDDIELQTNIVYGVSIGLKDDGSTVIANDSNIWKRIEDSELEYDYVTLKD